MSSPGADLYVGEQVQFSPFLRILKAEAKFSGDSSLVNAQSARMAYTVHHAVSDSKKISGFARIDPNGSAQAEVTLISRAAGHCGTCIG